MALQVGYRRKTQSLKVLPNQIIVSNQTHEAHHSTRPPSSLTHRGHIRAEKLARKNPLDTLPTRPIQKIYRNHQ